MTPDTESSLEERITKARRRYESMKRVEWMEYVVLESIALLHSRGRRVRLLDIGCGHGFSGCTATQHSIADRVTTAIGIEPDSSIPAPSCFATVHRTTFEEAPLEVSSVDLAYACFVLEHIQTPQRFFDRLHEVLAPGGIFIGFTVDARHLFACCSQLLEVLRLKDLYLRVLRGERGVDRYENYPTFYRANTPRQLRRACRQFSEIHCLTLHRPGQLDFYFPRFVRPATRLCERIAMRMGLPGSVLVVALRKEDT